MPIVGPELPRLDHEAFGKLDYVVKGHAFESYNELGRLCDESVYQADLASRLRDSSIEVQTEVPIKAVHHDFSKTYYIDLLVSSAFAYELKVVKQLSGAHEAQLLNYLFLLNSAHGKLINFGGISLGDRFVNAPITSKERGHPSIARDEFNKSASPLKDILFNLIRDWGLFLDLALYVEAITHFLGGEEKVIQKLPLSRDGKSIGNQRFHLFDDISSFKLTGLSRGLAQYESHLRRKLAISPLKAIHWINLNQRSVSLVTVSK